MSVGEKWLKGFYKSARDGQNLSWRGTNVSLPDIFYLLVETEALAQRRQDSGIVSAHVRKAAEYPEPVGKYDAPKGMGAARNGSVQLPA
jgi:hypothetical protein